MKKQTIKKKMGVQKKTSKKEKLRLQQQNADNEYILKWMGIWLLIIGVIILFLWIIFSLVE